MSANKIKSDSGLQPALQSVIKNEKFKRMLVFGLRSVAEFCIPPNNNYIHNSLAVIDQNALPIICRTSSSNDSDEDVSSLCAKVLWGVSEAVKQHPEMMSSDGSIKLKDKAMTENIGECLSVIIKAIVKTTDYTVLEFAFDALMNYYECDFALDVKAMCPGIVTWLSSNKLANSLPASVHSKKKEENKRDVMVKAVRTIQLVCTGNNQGVEGLLENQGLVKLLDALLACPNWVEESSAMTKNAFTAAAAAMNHPQATTSIDCQQAATKIVELMQKHKDAKVEELGGQVLVRMLQPEQIKSCLNALSTATPGSKESTNALKLLSIMAYVEGVAETLASTGGIGLLVEAVKKSADLINDKVSIDVLEGTIGAVKMLGKVAAKATEHSSAIVKSGGVGVLTTTIEKTSSAISQHPQAAGDLIAACMDACAILSREESNASSLHASGCITKGLKSVDATSSAAVASSAIEWLVVALGHNSVAKNASKDADFLLCSISKCSKLAPDDATHQCNCLKAYHHIAKTLSQCELFKSTGSLTTITESISKFASNAQVASAGAQLLDTLAHLPDATTFLCDGTVADALFSIIVQQSEQKDVKDKAMNALNISIATEADVTRALAVFKKPFEGSNVAAFHRALVAMTGLSEINRLSAVMVASNAEKELLAALKKLIDGRGDITERGSLIRCCLGALGNIVVNNGDLSGCEVVVAQLLENGQSASLKAVVDKQARESSSRSSADCPNSLVDLLNCISTIGKSGKLQQVSNIDNLVGTTTKIMRTFPDNRRIQTAALEVLAILASSPGGAANLFSSGGIKLVVQYMQKAIMFEDVQTAGLKLWAATLNAGPSEENADALKKAGAVDVLQAILRTHPNSASIKAELPPIHSALIPHGAVEGDLDNAIKLLNKSTETNDAVGATSAMQSIAAITRTPDGVKAAIKAQAAKAVSAAVTRLLVGEVGYTKKSPTEVVDLSIASANVFINIISNKAAATSLSKHCGVTQYAGVLTCLMADESPQAKEATRETISQYLDFLANLMKQDKTFAESSFRKGVASTVCKVVNRYPTDPSLVCDVFGVLGSFRPQDLAKTPEFDELLGKLVQTFANQPADDIGPKIVSLNTVADFIQSTLGDKKKRTAASEAVIEKIVLDHKIIDGLGKVLEVHRPRKEDQDKALVKRAEALLSLLSELRNLKDQCSKVIGVDVDKYARNIRLNKEDAEAAAISIRLLNQNVMKMDKRMVEGSTILSEVQKIALENPENRSLRLAANELLSNLGPDQQLNQIMKQIIQLVDDNVRVKGKPQAEDWPEQLNELSAKLYLFLGAEIADIKIAFEYTKPCCEALMAAMEKQFGSSAQVALQNGSLLLSIPAVTRNIGERFWEVEESPYGAHAMADSVFPTYTTLILTSSRCKRTRKFIIDGYRSLTGCLANSQVRPPLLRALDSGKYEKLPSASMALMNGQYAADPEAVQRILEFLSYMAMDAPGAEILKNTAMPDGLKKFVSDIEGLMTRNQQNGPTVAAALDLLGNIAGTFVGDVPPELSDERLIGRFEKIASGSPEGISAMTRFRGKLLRKKEEGDLTITTKAIKKQPGYVMKKCIEDHDKAKEMMACSVLQKCDMTVSMAELIESHVKNGRMDELLQSDAFRAVVGSCGDCLQGWDGEREVFTTASKVFKTLKRCALQDVDAKVAICKNAVPKLLEDFGGVIDQDPEASIALLDLLNTLVLEEMGDANAALLNRACPGLASLLDRLERLAGECKDPEQAEQLRSMIDRLREALKAEPPAEMNTLKKVLALWNANEDAVETTNSAIVLQHLDFVLDKTEEFSRTIHEDPHTELASEFICGCRCLSLLHRNPEWGPILVERGEHNFMMRALKSQTGNEENVCQIVVQTILDAIQTNPSLALQWVTKNDEDIATIIVDSINRIHESYPHPHVEKEGLILQRLQLMEVMAQNNTGGGKCPPDHPRATRMYFNDTNALNVLVNLWDDWRDKKYTSQLLGHTMRAMRTIYNETWIPQIVDRQVPRKLVDLVQLSKDADLTAKIVKLGATEVRKPIVEWSTLPDVLFLIGCVANNGNIRNEMSEMEVVESILKLLKVSMRYTSSTPADKNKAGMNRIESRQFHQQESNVFATSTKTFSKAFQNVIPKKLVKTDESELVSIKKSQMNGCLALATLNVGHNNNIARFGNNGGLDLNIELMNNAMGANRTDTAVDDFDYDVANAAAALICNSSYRRPDIQQLYGQKGACVAVMRTIKCYDGSSSVSSTRCLSSMMKAIANLALYPANVDVFLNHGIGETFEHLCETSETLSDAVMSVCLRTLSNLVMEFSEDSMELFSPCLPPLLQMLKHKNRNDPIMLALAFDVLGALCRIPENAQQFHELQGYSIVLEHLRTSAFAEHLNNFGLKLLVRQGRMFPESFPKMIDEGVFTFIISLVDNPKVPPYVVTSALRLLLRIIQSSDESATAFIQAGGLYPIFNRINNRDAYKNQSGDTRAPTEDGATVAAVVPSSQEVTTTTLSCWVIASLLLTFSDDLKDEDINQPILSPRSRRLRITRVLSKVKDKVNAQVSPSRDWSEKNEELATTKSSEVDGTREIDFDDVDSEDEDYDEDELASDRESSNERLTASAWKELNINPIDLANLSKSLCEVLLDELQPKGERANTKPSTGSKSSRQRRSSLTAVDSDLLLASAGLIAYISGEGLAECSDAMIRGGIVEYLKALLRQVTDGVVGGKDAVDLVRLCCMTIQLLGAHARESQLNQLCNPESGLIELLEQCAKIVNSQSGGKLLGLIKSKGIQGAVVATDLCLLSGQLLESGSREEFKEVLSQTTHINPLLLTHHNKDNYPNGVQDIRVKTKEQLRKGGDIRVLLIDSGDEFIPVIPTSTNLTPTMSWKVGRFQWRSSSDLLKFEWRLGKKGLYNHNRTIGSIRFVQTGWASNGFIQAAQSSKKLKLPRANRCCVLTVCAPGSASSEEISICFRTSIACRRFIALTSEWREAASSGMD